MTEVAFYHLQTIGLETALPQLLGKCLERDWKVAIEVGDGERIAPLDEHLWTFADASFLPHGTADSDQADRQPIVLCSDGANPNGAVVRFFIEGALPAQGTPLDAYQRVILMFDGNDEQAVGAARQTWKHLREASHALSYWKQSETGAWQKAG